MRRNALRVFFTRVLPLTLPLMAGCDCPDWEVEGAISIPSKDIPDGGFDDMQCAMECELFGRMRKVSYCAPIDFGFPPFDGGYTEYHCRGLSECIGGRRPEGFASKGLGQLARMAELEAASVHAFRILRDELLEHGAPGALVRAAQRSARDEARHARIIGGLAGVRPRVPPPPRRRRTLEEIAVENVREGCVRETFGAARVQLEAHTSTDRRTRQAMASIFPDEERHAELAFAVHAWLQPKLSHAARRRVSDARRSALAELASELSHPAAMAVFRVMAHTVFAA